MLGLKALIFKTFDRVVNDAEVNSELKFAVKRSDRVNKFIDNLYREFLAIEQLRYSKGLPVLKNETIEECVEGFTTQFISNFDRYATERGMSDLAKLALKEKEQHKQDVADAVDTGILKGSLEELDQCLTIGETEVKDAQGTTN